jgi:hypothetical protein
MMEKIVPIQLITPFLWFDHQPEEAADVALTTSFGPLTPESFKVWTDQISAS